MRYNKYIGNQMENKDITIYGWQILESEDGQVMLKIICFHNTYKGHFC